MNTFRNKQFKNQLDPKYAFYDCLRSCELKSSSEELLEECVDTCDLGVSTKKFKIMKNKKGAIQAPNNLKQDFF